MNNNFLINKLIAHRGIFDNKIVPENSIEAFKKAIRKDYIIELDVNLTKDKKIVVFHDDLLDRMTNKKGKIKDYKLDELKDIKLLNTNYSIPTLSEVLKLVKGKVPLLIEMKYDNKSFELPRLLLKELSDYNGEVAIQSFDPFLVSYFRFHKNNYLRGLLIDRKIASHILFLKFSILISKPSFLSVQKSLYNNKEINKYKNKKNIISWTMKSKEDIDKYKDKYDNLIVNISNCV